MSTCHIFKLRNVYMVYYSMYMLYRSCTHLLSDPFFTFTCSALCLRGLTTADRFPQLPSHLGSSWAQPVRSPGVEGRERQGYFFWSLLPLDGMKGLLWFQLLWWSQALASGNTITSDCPPSSGLWVTSHSHKLKFLTSFINLYNQFFALNFLCYKSV